MKLPKDFYLQKDVLSVSQELIGKVLCTRMQGEFTSGIITETEAYAGVNDKASHAYGNRRTRRTETMYRQGGVSYVYLCYGIHHLLNVVTNSRDIPHAVLIRGIHPLQGKQTILKRRAVKNPGKDLCSGPGKVSQALGVKTKHDNTSLLGNTIWIEDKNISVSSENIKTTPRIGVDYAGEDALLPYRFLYEGEFNE